MTTTTTYTDAFCEIADDVIRQLEDGAPCERVRTLAAGGYYFEAVRIFYAYLPARPEHGWPAAVARVALDVSPTGGRRPAHEVRVFWDTAGFGELDHYNANQWAADLAGAVLEMLDPTADYAR
jgi:hypothetical protein